MKLLYDWHEDALIVEFHAQPQGPARVLPLYEQYHPTLLEAPALSLAVDEVTGQLVWMMVHDASQFLPLSVLATAFQVNLRTHELSPPPGAQEGPHAP